MGYESLFTPFKIGNMEVKNRIGLSPMGTNSAFTNGRKDAQEIDYFIERAKGGTGCEKESKWGNCASCGASDDLRNRRGSQIHRDSG